MPAALFLDPRPQFRLDSGAINAGGELLFYTTGTLTAKNVYSNSTLATSLGNSVTLDAAGRTPTAVFLDGVYRVVEKDALGVQINSTDGVNIQAAAGTTALDPSTGDLDDVYSTDGTSALWRAISEVPDPTGHAGKYLGTDGTLKTWTAFVAAAVYSSTSLPGGVLQDSFSFTIGKYMVKLGSGSAATTGTKRVTAAMTFAGVAYSATPKVYITPTVASVTAAGANATAAATSTSTTGFTADFYAGNEHGGSDWNITSAVTFNYVAFGLIA